MGYAEWAKCQLRHSKRICLEAKSGSTSVSAAASSPIGHGVNADYLPSSFNTTNSKAPDLSTLIKCCTSLGGSKAMAANHVADIDQTYGHVAGALPPRQ